MRTVEAVLDEARTIDWSIRDTPLDGYSIWEYRPASVPAAFQRITSVNSKQDADRAYGALLNALGHDHSGTPYPAMGVGARLLAELVPLVSGWPLAAVVETLTECYLWTRGTGSVTAADGRTYDLAEETADAVRSALPALEVVARGVEGEPGQAGATDLLRALQEDKGVGG